MLTELITNNIIHVILISYIVSIAMVLLFAYLAISAIGKMNSFHVKIVSIIYTPGFIIFTFSILIITTHLVYK